MQGCCRGCVVLFLLHFQFLVRLMGKKSTISVSARGGGRRLRNHSQNFKPNQIMIKTQSSAEDVLNKLLVYFAYFGPISWLGVLFFLFWSCFCCFAGYYFVFIFDFILFFDFFLIFFFRFRTSQMFLSPKLNFTPAFRYFFSLYFSSSLSFLAYFFLIFLIFLGVC